MHLSGDAVCLCSLVCFMVSVAIVSVLLAGYDVREVPLCSSVHDDTTTGKPVGEGIHDTLGGLALRQRRCRALSEDSLDGYTLSPNIIVPHITSPIEASSLGWWMPHSRWTVSQQCGLDEITVLRNIPSAYDADKDEAPDYHRDGRSTNAGVQPPVNLAEALLSRTTGRIRQEQRSEAKCSLALGVHCKPDHIRATYQYLAIKKDVHVKGIKLSMFASALEARKMAVGEETLLGLLVVTLHTDGSNTTQSLDISEGTYSYQKYSKSMLLDRYKTAVAIVLMLGCHGHTGYAQFKDISLQFAVEPSIFQELTATGSWSPFGLLDPCPPVLEKFIPASQDTDRLQRWRLFSPTVQVNPDDVTLATQVSLDRIDVLEKSMTYWKGPMSVAVYVASKSQLPEVDHEWKKLYIKKKLKNAIFKTVCSVVVVFAESALDEYPINTLRNIAIEYTPTNTVLLQDADFVPSPNFGDSLKQTVSSWLNSTEYASSVVKAPPSLTAFVVPAFEFTTSPKIKVTVPSSKLELIDQVVNAKPTIAPFRQQMSPLSHKPVDYQRWFASKEPYLITSYQDKFEPYLVLRKTPSMPRYDESFRSYGMNKVSHVTELATAGYQFVVMVNAWALHVPHRESAHARRFLQDPKERLRNRLVRFQFVLALQRRYALGRCTIRDGS